MELVHYLRVVRRRWRTVAALTVIGLAIGLTSGLLNNGGTRTAGVTFYLAKHTLSSDDGGANLQRAAILCYDGDVPKRAAEKLAYDSAQVLAARVTCEARPDVNLLYVAATGTDPDEAVLIADTFATELTSYLSQQGETAKQGTLDTLDRQITEYENEYWQIQPQVGEATAAGDAARAEQLESRQKDISAKISQLRDQRNQVLAAPPADATTLTTLNTAEAIPISKAAYEKLAEADPTQKSGNGSVTGAATRQSQIDVAISDTGGMGMPMRAAIGAALGLVLGIVLVLVLDRVDPRIRTKAAAEEAFGWPIIGEIPVLTRRERAHTVLIAADEPRSRAAEAFRVLRSALLFAEASEASPDDHPIFASTPPDPTADAEAGHRGQVIMVTSPGPSEGKTTTVANLAAILAETGRSVLVVNCDFRRPRVHLHLDGTDDPRKVVDTKVPGVKLVTQVLENPHDANPAEVVSMQRQVIRNAREMFDIVLLDTAPILTTNDATEVLNVADQVVIVAKAGKTQREAADRAAELLERRSAPVVGAVLVGSADTPTSRYYYYGGNQSRGEAEEAEPLDELLDAHGVAAPPADVFGDGPPAAVDLTDAPEVDADTADTADASAGPVEDADATAADGTRGVDAEADPGDADESTAPADDAELAPTATNGSGNGTNGHHDPAEGNGSGDRNGHGATNGTELHADDLAEDDHAADGDAAVLEALRDSIVPVGDAADGGSGKGRRGHGRRSKSAEPPRRS